MVKVKKIPYTQDELWELFSYDASKGELIWNKRIGVPPWWNPKYEGKIAGSVNSKGRKQVLIESKSYLVSRVIYKMFFGNTALAVDHENGNKLDNRIQNLRKATDSQNSHNRGPTKRNKLGIKGIHRVKDRYRAIIEINGKNIHLGYFGTLEEAVAVRNDYSKNKLGDFHRDN